MERDGGGGRISEIEREGEKGEKGGMEIERVGGGGWKGRGEGDGKGGVGPTRGRHWMFLLRECKRADAPPFLPSALPRLPPTSWPSTAPPTEAANLRREQGSSDQRIRCRGIL